MSLWGAVLGGAAGVGLWLLATGLLGLRRPDLRSRVLPYLRDLPQVAPASPMPESRLLRGLFGPPLKRAADLVESVVGGSASVRRRLAFAGSERTVQEFRIEQVQWGLAALLIAAVYAVPSSLSDPSATPGLALFCVGAFIGGVLLRDNRLSAQVRERERRILQEFPVIAELLALAVVAGESPSAALERVVRRSQGAMAQELAVVLAQIRTGTPLARAFDDLAARSGLAVVARFAEGVAVSVERGTPLAEVLHAQAGDVREAARRQLIETGARQEVLMMVPVVFLILPVTIVFAFWPGAVGLSMVAH